MKDGGSMSGRDNLRSAKYRTTQQQQQQQQLQAKNNIGKIVRRVPERPSLAPPPRSLYPARTSGVRPHSQGRRLESELMRLPPGHPKQLAALKKRIWSNRELLESTTKTIQAISLEEDVGRARRLAAPPVDRLKSFGDLGSGKDWDKRLEDVTAEIHKVRNAINSNSSFQANVSSGIEEFHRVLTETMSTIRGMSAKSKEVEASQEEFKLLMDTLQRNETDAQHPGQLAVQKPNIQWGGDDEKPETDGGSGTGEDTASSQQSDSEIEDELPTGDH